MTTSQLELLREKHMDNVISTSAGDGIKESPVEQVRLMVPTTDNYTLPTLTFRTWVIGPPTCIFLAFITQFFFYRENTVSFSNSSVQLLIVVAGKMMAKTLPSKPVKVLGTNWTFSMNPGPFNIKEHVLITTLATSGLNSPYAISIITMTRLFFRKSISYWAGLLMTITTQMIGYGFAGIFMNLLVNSPYMWYPLCLVDLSFYRAMHEEETRKKGHLTKLQFFFIATVVSFAYAIIPSYFFPSLGALSFLCWICKNSVLVQLIGSGRGGFGMGSFALDWNAISGFLGNPLVFPMSTIANMMVGFILLLYVITPIAYWSNLYDAKKFPLFSSEMFDSQGQIYDISRALDKDGLVFNQKGYESYSKMYLSTLYTFSVGLLLSCMPAAITYFVLHHGRETYQQVTTAWGNKYESGDIHNKLMRRYKSIPPWWFCAILISMVGLAIFTCEFYIDQLQLPYWGVLGGCFMIVILILPLGVIVATTGQGLNLGLVSELTMGYVYPGKPIANLTFKSFCVSSMDNALTILSDLKLSLYLKIPPRNMFLTQVTGTFITSVVGYSTTWWIISSVKNMCDIDKLPVGSPWTCPSEHVVFTNTVIWGVIGPSRIFFPQGLYSKLYYFFIVGALSPLVVWTLVQLFPKKKWFKDINMPLILFSGTAMPAAGPVNYWSWASLGFLFNWIIFKRHKVWWSKYNYVLAYGIDMGVAVLAVLASLGLQLKGIYGVDWWGLDVSDHCPLALCPTAPGVRTDGCPTL